MNRKESSRQENLFARDGGNRISDFFGKVKQFGTVFQIPQNFSEKVEISQNFSENFKFENPTEAISVRNLFRTEIHRYLFGTEENHASRDRKTETRHREVFKFSSSSDQLTYSRSFRYPRQQGPSSQGVPSQVPRPSSSEFSVAFIALEPISQHVSSQSRASHGQEATASYGKPWARNKFGNFEIREI